jgi:hypothetical protein
LKPQAEQQATVLQHTLFPLPFSERRLILMGLDLLAVNGALLLALALVMQTQGRRQRPTPSG